MFGSRRRTSCAIRTGITLEVRNEEPDQKRSVYGRVRFCNSLSSLQYEELHRRNEAVTADRFKKIAVGKSAAQHPAKSKFIASTEAGRMLDATGRQQYVYQCESDTHSRKSKKTTSAQSRLEPSANPNPSNSPIRKRGPRSKSRSLLLDATRQSTHNHPSKPNDPQGDTGRAARPKGPCRKATRSPLKNRKPTNNLAQNSTAPFPSPS